MFKGIFSEMEFMISIVNVVENLWVDRLQFIKNNILLICEMIIVLKLFFF